LERDMMRVRFVCAALFALAVVPAPALAASGVTLLPTQAQLPGDASPNSVLQVTSISCASAGDCAATGSYNQASGPAQRGLALTEASGAWAPGVEAVPPDNVTVNLYVDVRAVSCGSAGNCLAVGDYQSTAGREGLLVSEASGGWWPGVAPPLPANAAATQSVFLNSVSCVGVNDCTAVGDYLDSASHEQALVVDAAGVWSQGVEASLPADAGTVPNANLNSISCVAPGECTTVGSYIDGSSHHEGLLLTETSGTWAQGVTAPLPANAAADPHVVIDSVSCPSAGECSAIGTYDDSLGDGQLLLLTESGGVWGPGIEASLPSDRLATQPPVPGDVSCGAAGECTAVGNYTTSSDHTQGVVLSQTSGTWLPAIKLPLPANAAASPDSIAASVSCAAAGSCSAVGSYTDSSGNTQGSLVDGSSGLWGPAVELPLPAGARANPSVELDSISCAAVDTCGATGTYVDNQSHTQGLLIDSTPPPVTNPQPSDAVVVTGAPTQVGPQSAIVGGTINPEGSQLTDCELEWGTDTGYTGVTMPCEGSVGSGTSPVPVSGSLSGLSPSTTYHYRFIAETAAGRVFGNDRSFTTSPSPKPPARARTLLSTASPARYAGTSSKVRLRKGRVTWLKIHAYSLTGAPISAQLITLQDGSHRELGKTNKAGIVILRIARGRNRSVVVSFAGSTAFAPAKRTLQLRYHK
jgi:hypothetical protein